MTIWRVRLFDGPVLERADGDATTRFRSLKVQGLLAYLALRLGRRCPREAIADALWPEESDAAVTANRLRVTLASLRRQLEPPGTPFGSVLDASLPGFVTLRAEVVECDAVEVDRLVAVGRRDEAATLLCGPLLPGLYDEWVRDEQLRFEALRESLDSDTIGNSPPPAPSSPRRKEGTPEPSAPAHRLPLYLTRFVGREAERQRLRNLIEASRLVTLTGPGGIGKTRLAVETAAEGEMPAIFASLVGAEGADRLAEAVLQAFGVRSRADDTPLEGLRAALRPRPPTLLILDNAEDQVDAAAELAIGLLEASPNLRLLVTSRQRLEVPGETVFALPPLALPDEEDGLEVLAASPSVALFLDRARSAVPDFTLRERHVEAVVAICRRLEGMPLALELAAARVAVQSPAGIAAALAENAMDLRSRQRGLSERHRSLRAAIQGSVEILAPDVRRFFARLSAFRGGWTAEAAAEVCDEPRAAELLEELLVRSLVLAREDEHDVRYAFLEPLRAYAVEALPVEEGEPLRRRHAAYFLALATRATEDDIRTLTPLDAEGENLRLALEDPPLPSEEAGGERSKDLDQSLNHSTPTLPSPKGEEPGAPLWATSRRPEGGSRDSNLYWSGLAGALVHAFVRGHHRQAVRWIEASAPLVAEVEDAAIRFRWRYAAGQILPDVGRLDETDALARAMRADAEATGDALGAIYAAVILAFVVELRGGLEASLALSAEALGRARAAGDRHLLETCLSHRSGTLHVYGGMVGPKTETGRAALAESEALARELRSLVPAYSRRLALGPLLVAGALWPQGRLEEAYGFFKEAEGASIRLGTTTESMYAFVSEAVIVAEWGFDEPSAELYGAFRALQERMGYSMERAQSSRPPWIERLAAGLRKRLGEAAFEALVARGRATPPTELANRWVAPREVDRDLGWHG